MLLVFFKTNNFMIFYSKLKYNVNVIIQKMRNISETLVSTYLLSEINFTQNTGSDNYKTLHDLLN